MNDDRHLDKRITLPKKSIIHSGDKISIKSNPDLIHIIFSSFSSAATDAAQ